MALPVEINPLQLKTSGAYSISKSLRFRSSASATLSRTPATATNRKTWTWSGWVKLGTLSVTRVFFGAGQNSTTGIDFGFQSDNTFFYGINAVGSWSTTAVFRDPSAWYHVVFAFDSTQATQANRSIVYINGVNYAFSSNGVVLNNNYDVNNNIAQYFGYSGVSGTPQYLDGYLAEVNFIDGQALTPSSFGTYDANGVWQPIKYSGSFGTNGFYLPFGTTTTTATLGNDSSGNGNTWTVNNVSLTAGTTYDSMTDSPTVSSVSVANYATLNPVGVPYNTGTAAGGNLNWTGASTADKGMAATISMSSGKWYWECTVTATAAGSNSYVGIAKTAGTADSNANKVYYRGDGATVKYGTATTGLATYTTGDVIGIAYDYTAQTLAFYKNNTLVTTVTSINLEPYLPWVGGYTTTESWAFNAGQRPFTYTPPTGFNALNTYNLPTPTIANGASYMAATLYTGDGTSSKAINNGTNNAIGTTFQPDLVWLKVRNAIDNHGLIDVVRGAPALIQSNLTAAEIAAPLGGSVGSFSSTGFTIAAGGTNNNNFNKNANTYVGWQWKAGNSSGVSNTNGSITSTVSANTTAGFSVLIYTGTGANATVGHGLGVAPSMIITKKRSSTSDWGVYHTSLTSAAYYLLLDTTAAQALGATYWNSTAPTSSVFSIGTADAVNISTATYVAYCWAAVSGYSAFGSYTGNASTDGTFVYTGFRPRWIMIKRTDSTSDWYIWDTSRDTYNVVAATLLADTAGAETSATSIDNLSNGFKCRSATVTNASGGTYVYAAFAENPFNSSRAR